MSDEIVGEFEHDSLISCTGDGPHLRQHETLCYIEPTGCWFPAMFPRAIPDMPRHFFSCQRERVSFVFANSVSSTRRFVRDNTFECLRLR